MTSETNTNTPKAPIKDRRVRTRTWADGTREQRVKRPDNTQAWAPLNSRFSSQVSYGFDQRAGTFNARSVTR